MNTRHSAQVQQVPQMQSMLAIAMAWIKIRSSPMHFRLVSLRKGLVCLMATNLRMTLATLSMNATLLPCD